MAHIDTGGSKGRVKNVDLNLVPFIDLMSVLITFLLISAVWTQVSMIQIGSSLYGKKNPEDAPPEKPPLAELVLRIDVKQTGYVLTVGTQAISIARQGEDLDTKGLLDQLQRVKQAYPEKEDAIIAIEDTLPYDTLIQSMDTILKAGFPSISVATGGPK